MIGTNHHVEAGFMDQLPFSLRDAAMDLLKFYRLKQLVEMHQTDVSAQDKTRFDLTDEQWKTALKAVILTKVSYFTITVNFPNAYINKLLEITAYALDIKGASLPEIYQTVEKEYPFFARWLKTVHEVKLTKYKLSQQHKAAK